MSPSFLTLVATRQLLLLHLQHVPRRRIDQVVHFRMDKWKLTLPLFLGTAIRRRALHIANV